MKPSAPTADPRPANETDELLMGRVSRDADATAFTILVHRYERELFVFLRRHLQCRELAEEAFQATFLQVHRHRGRFDAGRPFRPWIYAIAARQAIDAYRRDRRHRRPSLDASADGAAAPLVDSVAGRESTGDALVERAEARAAVRAAVERLPELLRRPLELVYQRGLRYREAAGILGVPVGTLKSRLHAALRRLGPAVAMLS
jgi:RNA polymerase sigma-70 factor (ECF subfamily)